MARQDELQPASFAGVPFKVEKHATKGGLRLAKHEYPGGDVGLVQNLGLKIGSGTIDAYCIGADYMQQRDALTKALLTQKQAGALVHPWLGNKTVWVEDWSISETTDQGGYCVISLVWIDGSKSAPLVASDNLAQAQTTIAAANDVVTLDFCNLMRYADELEPVRLDILAAIRKGLDAWAQMVQFVQLPQALTVQVLAALNTLKGDADSALRTPMHYVQGLREVMTAVADHAYSVPARQRVVLRLASGGQTLPYRNNAAGVAARSTAPIAVEQRLRDRIAILSAAQIAIARVQSSAGSGGAYYTASEVQAVQATLSHALDQQIASASAISPAVFQSLVDVRTSVLQVLQALIRDQRLRAEGKALIVQAMPAVVLAHNWQMDEAALIAHNGVRHPLFVQGEVRYVD